MFKEDNSEGFILNTKVKVGKSYSSKVWSLNKEDIKNWVPFEYVDDSCKLEINGIVANARIKFLPRLFFKGKLLENHLKKLYLEDKELMFIPLKINVPNNKSPDYIHDPVDCIETSLTVGNSYRSKIWLLSKDVANKLIPLDESEGNFSIEVDGIPAEGKVQFRFRLLYNDNKLSEYLEKLYRINPKQKVKAKIVFNNKPKLRRSVLKNVVNSMPKNNKMDIMRCSICGAVLEEDFDDMCYECKDKVLAINYLKKLYPYISNFSIFSKDDLLKHGFSEFKVDLMFFNLKKYDLIINMNNGCYKLNDLNYIKEFVKYYDVH